MVNRGVMQQRGNLGQVVPALADERLALLELDAADIFAGRNAQLPPEQRRQMRRAHADLLCHQLHGKPVIDMVGDVLQGAADELIFVVQRQRRFQAIPPAAAVAQDVQQQELEVAADEIAAVGVVLLGLAQNTLQQRRLR